MLGKERAATLVSCAGRSSRRDRSPGVLPQVVGIAKVRHEVYGENERQKDGRDEPGAVDELRKQRRHVVQGLQRSKGKSNGGCHSLVRTRAWTRTSSPVTHDGRAASIARPLAKTRGRGRDEVAFGRVAKDPSFGLGWTSRTLA